MLCGHSLPLQSGALKKELSLLGSKILDLNKYLEDTSLFSIESQRRFRFILRKQREEVWENTGEMI